MPFQHSRIRTDLGLCGSSICLDRNTPPSDVFVVTLRHARSGLCAVRCACRGSSLSRRVTEVHLRAVGLHVGLPVKAIRPKPEDTFRRLEEHVSRNPHIVMSAVLFIVLRSSRAPFRHLSARAPRQAVLRASFRLSPCSPRRPCDLSADKAHDASDRLLPPLRDACTRTSCVPGLRYRDFRHVGTSRILGSSKFDRGTRRFTTPETASADRSMTALFRASRSVRASNRGRGEVVNVGVLFPRCLPTIEPLTSLSPLSLPLHGRRAFACFSKV
jgi:hypothetical protein